MNVVAKTLVEDRQFGLNLRLLAGNSGLNRAIEFRRIQKPGLAIAGLVEAIQPGRVQVLGNTELMYLESLAENHQSTALEGLFRAYVPCIVVTTSLPAPKTLTELAEARGVSIFQTSLSSETFIVRVHEFFDEHLSPRMTMHGVLVDVFGVGLMLTGQSGVGKSECALDLILRGHQLVADDVVLVRQSDRNLVGMGSPLTKHHMEVRGLGIINVKDLFGAASVCERKRIELLIDLVDWEHDGIYDRLGLDDAMETILDVRVPKLRVPIRPGRNLSAIVEVAARNHLLKSQGHHAAQRLQDRLTKRLQTPPGRNVSEGETIRSASGVRDDALDLLPLGEEDLP